MNNARAALVFNALHIPVDIYHLMHGRFIFTIALAIGIFLIICSAIYLRRNSKYNQNIIHHYHLPSNRLLGAGTSLVKSQSKLQRIEK